MSEKEPRHSCLLVYPRNPNDSTLIIKIDPNAEMGVVHMFTSADRNERFVRIEDIDGTRFIVNLDRVGHPEVHTHEEGMCPFGDDDETNQSIIRFMRFGEDEDD